MNVPRLLISAASSGSGKTLMTCGILQALMNRGMKVSSFKCGPDYIDPMFHSKVIGTVSRNVDAFFSDDDTLRALFCDVAKDTDISVIEGVMGFYDGSTVEDSSASSCDVSLKLGAPVILLIDSRGAARSVLATLKGFLEFEENLVRGVIFNRMSERTFVKLKDQVEAMGVDLFTISRGMVNVMSEIRGVDIWVNFTESEDGVLAELRSSVYNINPIAKKYGGGGHAKASGATLKDRETAMQMLADLEKLTEETV